MGTVTTDLRGRAIKKLAQLPPFSPILLRLMATLAREDVSFAELAKIIERDTVLAGNVLRMVNSALYARRGTVNSVAYAIAIMGLHKLRNYALGVSISTAWSKMNLPKGFSVRAFNLHSVGAAIMADGLALQLPVESPESAFAAGLFHDLGKLLMAISLPDECKSIREMYEETGRPVVECEREVLGFDHTELSAEAVSKWNLPPAIPAAVRMHHEAVYSGPPISLSVVIKFANQAVNAAGYRVPTVTGVEGTPEEAVNVLEPILEREKAQKLCDSFCQELDVLKSFF